MNIIRIINKFSQILSSHQKLRIFELAILMVAGGFLEMMSVSLILPFMDIVMDPEDTMNRWYAEAICDLFNINSSDTFLILVSFALAMIYIFKNIYLILETNIQYRFVFGNMFNLQSKLLDTFLHRPYEYYLGVDSGEIIRIVSTDTSDVFSLLTTLLSLFTELVVSVLLIGTVFFIAPNITIWIAVVLIFLVVIINIGIKPNMRKAGLQHQKSDAMMNKWLLQSIQGIKELIVMRKEDFFNRNFDKAGEQKVIALRKNQILSNVPRFLIEATSMSVMFIVVAVMIYRGYSIESMMPALTAVAMAALRLLPSINRMSSALASISYSEPMLDKLIENLKNIQGDEEVSLANVVTNEDNYVESQHVDVPSMQDQLELRDISYRYPQSEKDVLVNASLIVRFGESIGLVGASGAGKTTAVDVILGLLKPQSGQVMVDGVDICEDMPGWLSQIGYIPQMIFMMDDTIRANVAFGVNKDDISDEEVWRAISEASLEDFVRSLPDGLDTEIGERGVRLSGGQRQRIGIARALYLNPSILILDEATSALDNETEQDIMESINHLHGKKTMIIIAHRLSTIEACDHVYRVEDGKISKER